MLGSRVERLVHSYYNIEKGDVMRALIAVFAIIALLMALSYTQINSSVAIGVLFVVGMASCVAASYRYFNHKQKLGNRIVRSNAHYLGPVVRFDLNFNLYLRYIEGRYYLPNCKEVQIADPELREMIHKCFEDDPGLFVREKKAGRLFKSLNDAPKPSPGPFQIMITFSFHYRPRLDPVDKKMFSVHYIEGVGYYKTAMVKELKTSLKSKLRSEVELIQKEIEAGRLKMVKYSKTA